MAALAAYGGLSLIFFGLPVFNRHASVLIGQHLSDPPSFVWYFAWWPYAISHGLNPFVTRVIWSPAGINLAWVTGIPGASLLASPITLLAGPTVAYNFASLAAPPLAAWTAYLLCRRVTDDVWASLAGGYIFGFSAYELGHLTAGHVNLILVFVVPLVPYLILLRLDNAVSPALFVTMFAAALIAQFAFSIEVFATLTGLIAANVLLALGLLPADSRKRLVAAVPLMLWGYAVAALALGPYLYYLAHAPEAAGRWGYEIYSSHLHNFVVPTVLVRFRPHLLSVITGRHADTLAEDVAYLGVPLLIVVLLFALAFRRHPAGRFLVSSFVLTCVLSLGPAVPVSGHQLRLPWWAVAHLPLIGRAHPARLMMYASLAVAVMAASWLRFAKVPKWITWPLVAAGIAALLPSTVPVFWHTELHDPAFFGAGIYRRYLAPGETVLIIPNWESMRWQAQTDMYFRMALTGNIGPMTPLSRIDIQREPILGVFRTGTLIPGYPARLVEFLRRHDVTAIVLVKENGATWLPVPASLGVAPVEVGDVLLYRLPDR